MNWLHSSRLVLAGNPVCVAMWVYRLRKILDDNESEGNSIETARRLGYRLKDPG
jgi:DNA-binding winged helix-turn-helix (wHTH) protein